MKKLFASTMAALLLAGSSMEVSAATMRDLFDAEYYANQYKDLKAAFGYNEEALWNHFVTNGIKEGRVMNPVIDIVQYRKKYVDLDKAFGNNWDSYVEHYIAFGAKERRETGTGFDLMTYLEAYEDLSQAFGTDLLAAANHYIEHGAEEGRELISEEAYEAFLNPVPEEDSESEEAPESIPAGNRIVQVVGDVDNATLEKVEQAFEDIVEKMRADGLLGASDMCVVMEGTSVKVDITFDDNDIDLLFSKDSNTGIYTLILDYDFTWLDGYAVTVNGKDSAPYNKELLTALFSVVSNEPQTLFDRIDMDYHSPAGLSDTEWTEVGDIHIMGGGMSVGDYISYKITTETPAPVYNRDASYVLTLTNSDGSAVECKIEYDSSLLKYEMGYYGKPTFSGLTPDPEFGIPYPVCNYVEIKSGCSSYEEFKQQQIEYWNAAGDPNASIFGELSYNLNGYTYYEFELFYETADAKGDPEIVYVQIGDNEYVEIYNLWAFMTLEEFVNKAFCITEVK